MANRIQLERDYWNENALDPDVDIKYISDVSDDECFEAVVSADSEENPYFVLDLGCGPGRIANKVQRYYFGQPETYGEVVGLDISIEMLNLANTRKQSQGPIYTLGDGRTIPFANETFDFVYSMLLFQHLEAETIRGYIKEAYRVLQPGGIFRFQFVEGTNSDGPFSNHYTYMQMSDWLREAGFVVDKVDRGLCHFQWCWVTARKAE